MHQRLRALLMVGLGLFVMLAQTQAPVRAQAAAAGSGHLAPAVTPAPPGQAYIHLSTPDNIGEDSTTLENMALNGNPNANFLPSTTRTRTTSLLLQRPPAGREIHRQSLGNL